MCEPATAGLIISAVAGAGSAASQQRTLRQQDRTAAEGLRAQSANQRKANQRVNQAIQDVAANTGAAERSQSLADFQDALRAGGQSTTGALDPVAGASERFAERVSAGKDELKTAGTDKAQRLSVIDGILRQRLNEGDIVGRAGSDIGAIGADIQGQDFLTRLRVANQRPNAGLNALLDVGAGVGAGLSQTPPRSSVDIPGLVRSGTVVDAPIAPPNPFGPRPA